MPRSRTDLKFEVLKPFRHEFETPGGTVQASYHPGNVYVTVAEIPDYDKTVAGWVEEGKARDLTATETKEDIHDGRNED